VCQAASVKCEQQQSINEDGEAGRGANGGFSADLWLAETKQSLLVAEIDFDLPAPQIRLKDLLW